MQTLFNNKKDEMEKPAALSAFLTPPSRLIQQSNPNTTISKDVSTTTNTAIANTNYVILTPEQISQKVASLLKPGPPFYSEVSSADLIENLSNASLMRSDGVTKSTEGSGKLVGWLDGLKKSLTTTTSDDGATTSTTTEDATKEEQPWTGIGTVWSALDSLPSGVTTFNLPNANETVSKIAQKDEEDEGLWSSVMLACDLDGKNLHLTQSCVVPSSVLVENHFYQGNKKALFTQIGAGTKYKWDDWSNETTNASTMTSYLTLYTMPNIEAWQWPSWVPYLGQKGTAKEPNQPSTPKPTGSKRIWVPSTTQVSVHATWWGYTIYIPVSVFPQLDSDVNQAEKIANLIHTVLMTILNSSASLPIPMALKAALTVLKAIAPSTSYISTFIGWSWNEIKSFNQGQGVELSATWLLPIALIPHTWDAAVAPADKNDDGTPDGPPTETTPAPEQPVPSTPSVPNANEGEDDNQPEQQSPATGGEDGDDNKNEEPISADPAPETPSSPEVTPVPDQDQPEESVPEEGAEPAVPTDEEPTQQEELVPAQDVPVPEDEVKPSEEAVPEESKTEEVKETEPSSKEEQMSEKELPKEPSSDDVEKEEEGAATANEPVETEEEEVVETSPETEEQAESSNNSIATSTEPTTPTDTEEIKEDPLEIAADAPLPPKKEEENENSIAAIPSKSTVEDTSAKPVEVKSAKVKKNARKLFGKVTNRI